MTVTVCVYLLFLYDQRYKGGTWELLDDSVYYVKVRAGHRRSQVVTKFAIRIVTFVRLIA